MFVTKAESRWKAFPLWKYGCYVLPICPQGQGCDGGIYVCSGTGVQKAQGDLWRDFAASLSPLPWPDSYRERSTPWQVTQCIFLMSVEDGPGLIGCTRTPFQPTACPLRRMFGQRQTGNSCRCRWWNQRWGRMQAKSQTPNSLDHHSLSPNVCTSPSQHPFPKREPAICNCLASPFPSFITCSFKTGLTQVSGLLSSRWTIQAGNEFVYNFSCRMRERKKKKGGEPDCWQCSRVAASVFNCCLHAVESRQIA